MLKKLFLVTTVLPFLAIHLSGQEYPTVHKTPQSVAFTANNSTPNSISPYVNGYFMVRDDNTGICRIMDSGLNQCGQVKLCRTLSFNFWPRFTEDGVATAVLEGEKCCIINTRGEIVKDFPYASCISHAFVDGIAMVKLTKSIITENGEFQRAPEEIRYIDTKGDFIYPELTSKNVYFGERYVSNVAPIKDGLRRYYDFSKERFGFLDADGRVVIPAIYTEAHDFSEGLAAVTTDETSIKQWGYIDVHGNTAIEPFVRTEPDDFHDGYAIITKMNGRKVFINKEKEVKTKELLVAHRFFNGYAIVRGEGTKALVLNTEMKIVNSFKKLFSSRLKYNENNQTITYGQYLLSPDCKVILDLGKHGRLQQPFEDEYALYNSISTSVSTKLLGFIDVNGEVKVYFVESEF